MNVTCKLEPDLDDANLVSHVQCIIIVGETNVSLLKSVWSDQCVDLERINLVQLLHGKLDLWLVGTLVNDEHQGVVVLNLLHGRLGGERVLDDRVVVHLCGTVC